MGSFRDSLLETLFFKVKVFQSDHFLIFSCSLIFVRPVVQWETVNLNPTLKGFHMIHFPKNVQSL